MTERERKREGGRKRQFNVFQYIEFVDSSVIITKICHMIIIHVQTERKNSENINFLSKYSLQYISKLTVAPKW